MRKGCTFRSLTRFRGIKIIIETSIVGTFSMDLQGLGNVIIDWTDGSILETVTLLGMGNVTVDHFYIGGGTVIISGATVITHISAPNQDITDILIPSTIINIEQINVQGNLLTSFETYPEWVNLMIFAAGDNALTSFNTYATWVNLVSLTLDINQLITLATHAEWVLLEVLGASENLLTAIVLRPEWIKIININLHDNYGLVNIGGTYAAWVDIQSIELTSCPISAITTFAAWVDFYRINVYDAGLATLEAHSEMILYLQPI